MMTRTLAAIVKKEAKELDWPQSVQVVFGRQKTSAKLKTAAAAPDWLKPNEALILVQLHRPLDVHWGDRFKVFCRPGGQEVTSGRVIDPSPEIKNKELVVTPLLRLLSGQREAMILALCRRRGVRGVRGKEIVEFSGLPPENLLPAAEKMELKGLVRILGFQPLFMISTESLTWLAAQVEAFLRRFHRLHPEAIGVEVEKIKKRFRLPSLVLSLALARLKREKKIIAYEQGLVSLASHEIPLGPEEKKILKALEEMCYRGELRRVSLEEIRRQFRLSSRTLEKLLSHLMVKRRIVQSANGFYLHSLWLEEVINRLRNLGKREFSVSEFKALTGLSRKYAIPLLELLDEMGITRRKGSLREIL
jgi:selenocysteine-specific elongation factor